MQIANLRHQLHLYRKKALILSVLLFSVVRTFGQYYIYEHEAKYLQRDFHFGISLALNTSNYKITIDSNYLK